MPLTLSRREMSFEFGIHEIHRVIDLEALITGRCFQGPIRIGMRFLTACEVIVSNPEVTPERRFFTEVDLKITRIEAYGQFPDELDEGLTGAITVSGRGVAILKPRM